LVSLPHFWLWTESFPKILRLAAKSLYSGSELFFVTLEAQQALSNPRAWEGIHVHAMKRYSQMTDPSFFPVISTCSPLHYRCSNHFPASFLAETKENQQQQPTHPSNHPSHKHNTIQQLVVAAAAAAAAIAFSLL
jgi:hypothetical protein